MKKLFVPLLPLPLLALCANAAYITAGLDNLSRGIPANDPCGIISSVSIPGPTGPITQVEVTMDLFGGPASGLYAYLYHDGQMAVLLNRVGVCASNPYGYDSEYDQGFISLIGEPFTFADNAASDIHYYQAIPGSQFFFWVVGTWQPDGRNISPLSPAAAFNNAPRSNMLSVFDGTEAGGTWTLFIANVWPLGQDTLYDWSVEITTVPEPSTALAGLTALGLAVWLSTGRSRGRRCPGSANSQTNGAAALHISMNSACKLL
jgi:hypothetical protein